LTSIALPGIEIAAGEWPADWPEEISLIMIATVNNLCSQLESLIPRPLTEQALSASPGNYVPALKYMLRDLGSVHEQAKNEKKIDLKDCNKDFLDWPNTLYEMRFISLYAEILASILPSISRSNKPSDYINVYHEVFDVRPLHIRQ
jgi:hypothetical protein